MLHVDATDLHELAPDFLAAALALLTVRGRFLFSVFVSPLSVPLEGVFRFVASLAARLTARPTNVSPTPQFEHGQVCQENCISPLKCPFLAHFSVPLMT